MLRKISNNFIDIIKKVSCKILISEKIFMKHLGKKILCSVASCQQFQTTNGSFLPLINLENSAFIKQNYANAISSYDGVGKIVITPKETTINFVS